MNFLAYHWRWVVGAYLLLVALCGAVIFWSAEPGPEEP